MSAITTLYKRFKPSSLFSGENRIARYMARKLLSDMEETVRDKTFQAEPFVQYGRHFSTSDLHMGRFQNFIAEKGILRDLLAINWFKGLAKSDWIYVSPLFGHVLHTDNVQRSIQNRPQFLKFTQFIETFSPEGKEDGKSVEAASPVRRLVQTGSALRQKPMAEVISANKPLRYTKAEPTPETAKLLSRASRYIGKTPPAGFETVLVTAIMDAASSQSRPADVARLMSAYELCYGENPPAVTTLAVALDSMHEDARPDLAWLNTIAFNDRVLVSSLFRRMEAQSATFALWLASTDMSDKIVIGSQDDVAQLVDPDLIEREEKELFKQILSGEVARSEQLLDNADIVSGKTMTSEQVLKLGGWYKIIGGPDWIFSEAIRTRSYTEVIATAHDSKALSALSPTFRMYAAATSAYLGRPIPRALAKQFPGIPKNVSLMSGLRAPAIKTNAETVLFRREIAAPNTSPRALWLTLQTHSLAGNLELFDDTLMRLSAIYSGMGHKLVRDRLVSFDTFLITELPRILNMASKQGQWTQLPTQALIAFAYCAISTGQAAIMTRILSELETRKDMARNLYIPMMQAYQLIGMHHIDALLENTNHKEIVIKPAITRFGSKDKVLALIEGPASLRALRNITGKPEQLHCVPVQPIAVTKLPDFATITQVDDIIRTYGEEDAVIGAQVDEIITDYISGTKKIFHEAGFDALIVDTLEASHANLFFPAYRDMLNLYIAQQYVQKADEYDHIILIMHNGLSYGPLIKDLIEKVGKDRLHITIQNDRRDISIAALNEIRRNFDLPAIGRERPYEADWAPNLRKWMDSATSLYQSEPMSTSKTPYALACLEHINGYGDSYKALVNENLKHGDVELCISVANKELQSFIDEGGFAAPPAAEEADSWGNLRQVSAQARPEVATLWLPGLLKALSGVLDDSKSALLPQWKHMFTQNVTAYMGQRLPRIFDAMAYLNVRFDKQAPTHVMTGPNQHIFSRVASYVAKSRNVRVYDFLILANTDHPRYRPPVADIVYLYDGWYKEIFRSFFKFKASQLRQSGPLFRYSDRLETDMTNHQKTEGLRDIVLFSQSANFESTKAMLQAVCNVIAGRNDIALTVKLHPHESPANVERFTQIANEGGVKDNLTVIHKDDAVALVNKADLVIQSFSNIGLDAFLLGKPVITYKPPTTLTSRIFLYEKEIGLEVSDAKSLESAVKGQLDSPKARKDMAAKAAQFAKENAHFLRKDNAGRVVTQIHKDLDKAPKTKKVTRPAKTVKAKTPPKKKATPSKARKKTSAKASKSAQSKNGPKAVKSTQKTKTAKTSKSTKA